ncbi:diacylglycerol O-acyltransferase 3-1 [Humulus lupulus]|uniref:diacylglycerol O-acyltransferase 3-1 n=1 Tax=Humulus lupulus TaxID=3486 RepID=UPI002B4073C7|nr:diacylglycerol O-acyltransferase 3-1 [Humulus lupulus]
MEVSGFLSRRVSCFPGVAVTAAQSSKPSIRVPDHRDSGVSFGLRSTPSTVKTGFRDLGHLEYYSKVPIRCGGKKKKDKEKDKTYGVRTIEKKLTLLEALSMSNNLNADMDHQVHNNMISEAANELLTQLEQLRAEEKELKMKRKQLKAKLKAERMASMMHCESSSSSSSSESSDSECDEVVDMKQLRSEPISQPLQEDNGLPPIPEDSVKLLLSLPSSVTTSSTDALIRKGESELGKPSISSYGSSSIGHVNGGGLCNKKVVEVCMGNKCKKSGSVALVEEFERVMGAEGAVVGCKCMGKCKAGPNVRVLNRVADESVRTVANPLCIGVGLEDVNHIVANLFREDTKDMGLAAAV